MRILKWIQPYITAILAVTLALILKLLLDKWIQHDTPFLLFFASIIASAYYQGIRAGLTATILAALAAHHFFLAPIYPVSFHQISSIFPLIFFCFEGALITFIISALHTAKRKAEAITIKLQDSEEQFSLFMNNMPGIAFIKDVKFRHLYFNNIGQETFRWTADEWQYKTNNELFPEAIASNLNEHDQYVINEKKELRTIEFFPHQDETHHYLVSKFPVFNSNKILVGIGGIAIDITERIKSEAAIQESEEKFRSIFEFASIGITLFDKQGRSIESNSVLQQMIGYSNEELRHLTVNDVTHPDDVEEDLKLFQELILGKINHYQLEKRYFRKNGSLMWGRLNVSAVENSEGKASFVITTLEDITDQKLAQEELFQRQQEFRALVENSPDIIARVDQELRYLYINPAIEKVTGIPPEQFISKNHQELESWSEKYFLWGESLRDVLTNGTEQTTEYTLSTTSGNKYYQSRIVPEFSRDGLIQSALSVTRDITQQKQIESALKNALQKLNFHVENSPLAVVEWDKNFRISRWSKQAEHMFGWKSEEVICKHPDEWGFIFGEDVTVVRNIINRLSEGIEQRNFSSHRNYRKDGVIVECEWYSSALLDESGKLVSVLSLVLDVSDRKRAEAEAAKASDRTARLQAITASLSAALTPVQVADVIIKEAISSLGAFRGIVTLLKDNQTELEVVRAVQYPQQILESWKPFSVNALVPIANAVKTEKPIFLESLDSTPTDYPELADLKAYFGEGALVAIPMIVETKVLGGLGLGFSNPQKFSQEDGEFILALGRHCAQAIQRAQLYKNQVVTALERARLISQLKQQKQELETANRMKDEFLAVLSHELRTPLNSMLGWAKLLRTRKFDQPTTNRALETIERNATVQTQIIEDILDVSRIIQGKLQIRSLPINLVPIIETAINTVRSIAETKAIEIEFAVNSSVDLVTGDPDRLQQVLWNLLSNSIKFTPKGGRVEVYLEQVESDAVITIKDTGKGISADFLPYVFDRFRQADSSTTRVHGGLGLGLAIVRHLVELHGGTVEASSEGIDRGATFTVKLPLLKDDREGIKDQINSLTNPLSFTPQNSLKNLHILVVDDESDSRELLTVVLEESGAIVMAVGSANEAIAAIEQLKPDVLISDIGMPGEDGYSLIRKIRAWESEAGGNIPAIALTAYAREEDAKQAYIAGFQIHLPKPLNSQDVIEAVAKLTGRATEV